MGSVFAASAPSPPTPGPGGSGLVSVPPGFTMPSVSPVSVPGSSLSGHQETEPPLSNPGGFEECHRKCKGMKIITLRYYDIEVITNQNY